MLQVTHAQKKYGTTQILNIASLQLNAGIYWIQGSNGSGKTTFLKMIAGLLPFAGDIWVNDISLKQKPVLYRSQISWSEAEPLFPLFMTGSQLVNLYCTIRKTSTKEAFFRSDDFGMKDYIDEPIGTYSAGMTKKLSLLLAFIGQPSLIILDEPFITLDSEAVTKICEWIWDSYTNHNTSFLLSSHQEIDKEKLSYHAGFRIENKTIITA